jgi:CRISPR system Cascade subunit CasA
MSGFSYNLVDEPWISCTSRDGTRMQIGLRELLATAHELRGIESQNPLTAAALLRVLLALVHRVVDGPRRARDWRALYTAKRFAGESIDKYFQTFNDRFDLFSDTYPFYQTAGLSIVDAHGNHSPVSAAVIMHERASGNNKTIFDHTTDDTPLALTPAQAALALITTQMFALGGLNKKTTKPFGFQQSYLNAPMVSGIFIALTGESLFETLMLNLLLPESHTIRGDNDKPVWERDDAGADRAIPPKGYLDFLTCKCRHIRLLPERIGDAVIVSKLHIAQGEAFPDVENPAFMRKKNVKTGEWYCLQLDPDRLVWRDSTSLFAFDTATDHRPAAFRQAVSMHREVPLSSQYLCTAIALANDKANPLAWRKEILSVPFALLENEYTVQTLTAGMGRADDVARILDGAVKTFIRNVLPPNSKDVNEKAAATGAMRFYWDRLERHFHTFLGGIEKEDESLREWYGNIAATVRHALESCVRQRYADSAASLKAWAAAGDELNRRLAGLNSKQGGGTGERK